ncbi:TspO and MBR related proteins [Agreia bicolorata]|uniref:TspO and MBR related proteins n=1 Tax=Agreia bicolorata TaxID=110935 RepID=A0A1T4XKA3_9MICO|nr:tryptophan-rich sensory protein [Agreia bicolorata]SKA90009.1 TspO and MBR related proteins [Agreia bicolorata]
MSSTSTATRSDRARQITVAVSAVIAVVGSFIGSGAAGGTPIQNAAGGALGADSTPIAPAGPAFSIWSVIYLGLLAYAVWQLLPAQASAPRQRLVGYWVAASLVLNAAWILSVQFDQLALSCVVIVLLLAVLARTFLLLVDGRSTGLVETIVLDGTMGLYLGWVSIATAANLTAGLTVAGFDGFGWGQDAWAVIVLAVAALVGVLIAIRGRGRLTPAASLAWGLAWVAVSRTTGDLVSQPATIAAIVAAAVLVIATLAIRIATRFATRSQGTQR